MQLRQKLTVLMTGLLLIMTFGCETSKMSSNVTTQPTRPMRIVCIGDSLTTCGGPGGQYTDYLASWLPGDEVINKGIGGDTLGGGRKRYEQDVLKLAPDVVVIELGANDFWSASRSIKDLAADLEYMVSEARRSEAQVVIASCFGDADCGDTSPEFRNQKRFQYASGIAGFEKDIAASYGAFYVPNMQVDIKPVSRKEYWSDSNHPNKAGNEFVARRILAQLQKALREKNTR